MSALRHCDPIKRVKYAYYVALSWPLNHLAKATHRVAEVTIDAFLWAYGHQCEIRGNVAETADETVRSEPA